MDTCTPGMQRELIFAGLYYVESVYFVRVQLQSAAIAAVKDLKAVMTATLSTVTAAAPLAMLKAAGPAQVEAIRKLIHALGVSLCSSI